MQKTPNCVHVLEKQVAALEKFVVTRNIVNDEINTSFPYLTDREREFVNYDVYNRTFYGSCEALYDILVDPAVFQDPSKDIAMGPAEDADSSDGVEHEKPRCSYADLIRSALLSSPDGKLTLSEIYSWIKHNYPFFKKGDPVWQNSIRHNLSLNKSFRKISRETNSVGKGGYWAIDESFVSKKKARTRSRKNGSASKGLENGCNAARDVVSKTTKESLCIAASGEIISEDLRIITGEGSSSQYKCKLVIK